MRSLCLSTIVRPCSFVVQAGIDGDLVECLILNPVAWVRSPVEAKVISIFSSVTPTQEISGKINDL